MKKRVFISFDYDNDVDLKILLIGQARNPDSPFDVTDMSIKKTVLTDWEENARRRIKGCDVVVVICGYKTDKATGVSLELKMAQEEGVPYILIKGRATGKCVKPTSAKEFDRIHDWTWDNLKLLVGGSN